MGGPAKPVAGDGGDIGDEVARTTHVRESAVGLAGAAWAPTFTRLGDRLGMRPDIGGVAVNRIDAEGARVFAITQDAPRVWVPITASSRSFS